MYEFTNKMRNVSGKGEPYETTCRKMIKAGLEYRDKHPKAIQKIDNYNDLKEFYEATDSDITGLRKAINGVQGEITAPMVIAVLDHLQYADRHGWDDFVGMMEAQG